MTQEEKFEEAKRLYETANADQRYVLESLFPELSESGDDRIRKEIISAIKEDWPGHTDWIAWLEKQEQKPAWSEEDEEIIEALISLCDGAQDNIPQLSALKNWLKSLKDRVQPQPKQVLRDTFGYEDGRLFGMNEGIGLVLDNPEKYGLQKPVKWREEDEDIINKILCICNDFKRSFEISPVSTKVIQKDIDKIDSWLKSLRPQSQWKPSDEQIEALDDAIAICSERDYETECRLDNLRQELKKLKG